MVKQHCKFDKEYNLIKYWETSINNEILYSIKYEYFKIKIKNRKINSDKIFKIYDSNGWIRKYNDKGSLQYEKGNPNGNSSSTNPCFEISLDISDSMQSFLDHQQMLLSDMFLTTMVSEPALGINLINLMR